MNAHRQYRTVEGREENNCMRGNEQYLFPFNLQAAYTEVFSFFITLFTDYISINNNKDFNRFYFFFYPNNTITITTHNLILTEAKL